jgi:hypothetical protein
MLARSQLTSGIQGRSDGMPHFVGLDVSLKETAVCVVDEAGKVVIEQKVALSCYPFLDHLAVRHPASLSC